MIIYFTQRDDSIGIKQKKKPSCQKRLSACFHKYDDIGYTLNKVRKFTIVGKNICLPQRRREHGDVVFSLCRETAAKGKYQPYRAKTITLSPQGQAIFAHRRLPMGKKDRTLCALCVSVVNKYYLKYITVIMN